MSDQEPNEEPQDGAGEGGHKESENADALGIAMTMEEYDAFQKALDDALAEAERQRDSHQRALADYNNLRRRTELEREQMRSDLVGKILNPFIDVLDDLDLALQNRPPQEAENGWGAGIELVYRKLLGKLEGHGVRMMDVSGMDFDPHYHEAISHEHNEDFESGQIIAVVKPGFMIGDRVLRPAMVRVAA